MWRVELPGSGGDGPKKAVVVSYVPLLTGEPGRVLSVGDEEFKRLMAEADRCPSGLADACLGGPRASHAARVAGEGRGRPRAASNGENQDARQKGQRRGGELLPTGQGLETSRRMVENECPQNLVSNSSQLAAPV
jgi:hypothetical protein